VHVRPRTEREPRAGQAEALVALFGELHAEQPALVDAPRVLRRREAHREQRAAEMDVRGRYRRVAAAYLPELSCVSAKVAKDASGVLVR
jgi:hypothetical protein